jgi:hypothetical protein
VRLSAAVAAILKARQLIIRERVERAVFYEAIVFYVFPEYQDRKRGAGLMTILD